MNKIKVVSMGYAVFFEGDNLEVIDRSTGGSSGGRLIIVRLGKSDLGKKTIAVFNTWEYWQEIEKVDYEFTAEEKEELEKRIAEGQERLMKIIKKGSRKYESLKKNHTNQTRI